MHPTVSKTAIDHIVTAKKVNVFDPKNMNQFTKPVYRYYGILKITIRILFNIQIRTTSKLDTTRSLKEQQIY